MESIGMESIGMHLELDDDELNACVQCGLCLPHCPTFRVTGDESYSPRGRIGLMRAARHGGAPLTLEVVRSFETCVQCSGCETACPSGVQFGHLMEQTRHSLVEAGRTMSWSQRFLLNVLLHPRWLRAGTRILSLLGRMKLVPSRIGLPGDVPFRHRALRASGEDVDLFTGCVQDAWQRGVLRACQHVIESAGFGVAPTNERVPCCGALHSHAGYMDRAKRIAAQVIEGLPGDRPVIVASAGCGAAMKAYGELLGTEEARRFSNRVFDIQEWLVPHLGRLPQVRRLELRVAVQDPCQLRHVQRVHEATLVVLEPFVLELDELDDEGLCCGAGGLYSLQEPRLAGQIRRRKIDAIERSGAEVVASANPGCSMHLSSAGVRVKHPMELISEAIVAGRDPKGVRG